MAAIAPVPPAGLWAGAPWALVAPDLPVPGLAPSAFGVERFEDAPVVWHPQDPADSLYRSGQAALNRNDYRAAVDHFRRVHRRYPRSAYAGDALYWEGFAHYRIGGREALRTALEALDAQERRYPDAATHSEGLALKNRVLGELARLGDAEAAERIAETAGGVAPPAPPRRGGGAGIGSAPPPPPSAPGRAPGPPGASQDEDDDIRLAALNALLQMDAERAVPILKRVLERRDTSSVKLRRKAVFLLSQKKSPETTDIMLDVVTNDPDPEVRQQAVFWLSQVHDERAVDALEQILRTANDRELQEKAIFALSQHRSARAGQILRDFAARETGVDDELREKAIFWLSQHRGEENSQFLRDLYGRVQSVGLKEKIIFSISQTRGEANGRWLLDIALNEREPLELRKHALFWAGQSRSVGIADFIRLYDTMNDREVKEQLIFVYSQRREPEAVDKLMDIARRETDPDLQKKAIFWLGQSKDPRVVRFFEEIINR